MTSPGYRSYVIRAWTRPSAGDARARVQIELVESGEEVDIRGAAASRLAAAVEAAIREASSALARGEPAGGGPAGGGQADEPASDGPRAAELLPPLTEPD